MSEKTGIALVVVLIGVPMVAILWTVAIKLIVDIWNDRSHP